MHIPLSLYRVQLNEEFSLQQLSSLLPYFKKLGLSDLYLSPILQAQPGSTHGYNTTDFEKINPELGGIEALYQLHHQLKQQELGLCLDIVPNHMAATPENPYWNEVLEKGKASAYADFFDINWEKSTAQKLVYRRFFDINELVCLHTEDLRVFLQTHRLLLKLIQEHVITSLRIDHIDGLRDPLSYLNRLKESIGVPFHIVAEKILGYNEQLPNNWPLCGTTGYDFLNEVNQVLIEETGLHQLVSFYEQITPEKKTMQQVKRESLRYVITNLFPNEFRRLCEKLKKILGPNTEEIDELFLEFSTLMPRYRIYDHVESKDIIEHIFSQIPNSTYSNQFKSLLNNDLTSLTPQQKVLWHQWRNDWEVFSGPVMAKGFEDTACYNYYPLLSLNEVGSSPENFQNAGSLERFHQFNQQKQKLWPYSFNTTSTHDSKRSEDVRARIDVLSELYYEWTQLLEHWLLKSLTKKPSEASPDLLDKLFIYQSLLGVWPLQHDDELSTRMTEVLIKTVRERKNHSSWMSPNSSYEEACTQFLKSLLHDQQFMDDFLPFQKKIAFYGMLNSLTQIILKMTCPGLPDIYQGNETWRFDLVDPDNRRPINYQHLHQLFSDQPLSDLLSSWQDGKIKFNLTKTLLFIRRSHKNLFLFGDYNPLPIHGSQHKNIIAFVRQYKEEKIALITCRWFSQIIPPNLPWSSNYFTDEYCLFSERQCISLLNGEQFLMENGTLWVKDLLRVLPFNLIKILPK